MPRWLIDSLATGGPVLVVADTVAKATMLLCLTTAVAAVLSRSAAAVRHRLWGLTLGGLIILPFLSWTLPGWRLTISRSMIEGIESRASGDEQAAESGSHQAADAGAPGGIPSTRSDFDHGRSGLARTWRPDRSDGSNGMLSRVSSVVRFLEARGVIPRGSAWVVLFWMPGFLIVALPALAGVVGNEWRRRQSRQVIDANWLHLLQELARQLAIHRSVELRTDRVPLVPMTWGIVRPVVLLPEQAEEWPEDTRRLVLLHELAHIKRFDLGFQLIGRLAAAIYWFHPLAWYARHRLRVDCECACDDHVIHLGTRRTDYAQQLVDLARSLRAVGVTTALPLFRKSALEVRIQALFDDGRSHRPLGQRPSRALLAGALVLMTALASIHPGTLEAEPAAATDKPRDAAKALAQTTVAPAAEKPSVTRPEGALPRTYTHPITITGRAIGAAGKPIPGARVYLASRWADYKRIAETTTNTEGRYEFHDVLLPIERANTVTGRETGAFQVFGQAEGRGFAWRPQKWFYPQPKPANIIYEPVHRDPPGRYEASDKIELDLRFLPTRLSGTIVDDRGNALSGVRLEIRDCESLAVVDDVMPGWTLDALNERDSAPPSMKIRTTDARGRFEFTGLPANCQFRIDVRAKGFTNRWVYAATTPGPQPAHDGSPVLTGDFTVTLATPLEIPVKMVFGDTGRPAPRVAVQAVEGLVSTLETTNDQGLATLRLPPGKYRMENWPARGTPYLVTEDKLLVGTKPPAEPVVRTLRPAGIIEILVVDAESGAGVPNVDVWRRTKPDGGRESLIVTSWEVATRIAWRESPRTDARGKLRALVEPGTHQIGVGFQSYPLSHEVVESGGQEVKCRSGETVQLKFIMRKRH